MLKKIQEWLADPKRDYHEGLEIFNAHASSSAKAQFSSFFNEIKPDQKVDQFDSHFTLLVNQVVFVQIRLKNNPKAFAAAGRVITGVLDEVVHVDKKTKAPASGLKLEELPKQFDKERERLKELVPLMASVHAEMASAKTDEDRAALATQLVELDLERRSIWDRVDNYLQETNGSLDPNAVQNEYSPDDFVRGAQMAARVKRLKDNIRKNEAALESHKEKGKDHLIGKTQLRIKRQTAELAELEAELAKTETKEGDE